MRFVVCGTEAQAGYAAASHVLDLLRVTDHRVLGLATGSSPKPLYEALASRVSRGVSMSDVRAFALDEYVGISRGHEQSYHRVIARDATGPLGLDPLRVHVPDGQAADPDAAALAFEELLATHGGAEVQILGLGVNGHIGFNEPGSSFDSRTRVVHLAESTRRANSRFFESVDDVPTHAVTQGIATIMSAAHIVLTACGSAKAEAVRRAVEGPMTTDCPASVLQAHANAVLFVDFDSASLLDESFLFATEPLAAGV